MGATGKSWQVSASAIDPGTSVRLPTPFVGPVGYDRISYEIGACFNPVETGMEGLSFEQMQVLAFLRNYKHLIIEAERRYGTDRRAIAGAIAFEMLRNPHPTQPTLGNSSFKTVGTVGKFHLLAGSAQHWKQSAAGLVIGTLTGDAGIGSLAYETEKLGYRPALSFADRTNCLSTPEGAIPYIGACMKAFSDISEFFGFGSLLRRPDILTNLFQAKNLSDAIEHFARKPKGEKLAGGNKMDVWVLDNMAFIEDAVGTPGEPSGAPGITDELRDVLKAYAKP